MTRMRGRLERNTRICWPTRTASSSPLSIIRRTVIRDVRYIDATSFKVRTSGSGSGSMQAFSRRQRR
jgi:hypothetical protein